MSWNPPPLTKRKVCALEETEIVLVMCDLGFFIRKAC